jgi:D-beta-D-heptose 7-phosphate kinase/D-beta-D-heptose 1-phosphate adenosyltransferase
MITFSKQRLDQLFHEFNKRKIVLIGDLMLDRYLWGLVSRISPEAPVPIVNIESESFRFGGAANVSHNVMSLGATAIPVGVIGSDGSGETLKRLFEEKGFPVEGLVADPERPTTVKTRIIAHNQQVVRTDREVTKGISRKIQRRMLDFLESTIRKTDGIILEDYNKGLLVPHFIEDVIRLARSNRKMIFVDPKFDHFFDYTHVTLFKPNRNETADRLGIRLDSDAALEKTGFKLLEKLECKVLLVTLGEAGMALFEPGKAMIRIPTRAVKVHDVSGAGDTVIATMAVAMTSGANSLEAATLANHAAGIVCGEVGIVPIEREKLFKTISA